MKLRPFLTSLSIGTDICQIARIRRLFEKDEPRFLRRLLTPRELGLYNRNLAKSGAKRRAEFLAGRWAAKEACIKAVQPRRITLHEVEIHSSTSESSSTSKPSSPVAIILDRVTEHSPLPSSKKKKKNKGAIDSQDQLLDDEDEDDVINKLDEDDAVDEERDFDVKEIEGQVVKISIAHDGDYASAVALAPEMHERELVMEEQGD